MKKITILFLTILYTHLYAQTGFYIHPELNYKLDFNHNGPITIKTNQGFVIEQAPNNFTSERTVFFGAMIGYRRKFWYVESGCIQDKWASGVTLSANVYDASTQLYKKQENIFYGGQSFYKIPLRLGIKLWGNDSIKTGNNWRWQYFLELSINEDIRSNSMATGNAAFIINPNGDALTASYYSWSNTQQTKAIGIIMKGSNKKGRNLNVSLTYGFSNAGKIFIPPAPAYNFITFTNYDKTTYNTYTQSYGAGIYLGVSTDLYLKNKNKPEAEKIRYEKVVAKKQPVYISADTLPHKHFQASVHLGTTLGNVKVNLLGIGTVKVYNQTPPSSLGLDLGYAYKNWAVGLTFMLKHFTASPNSGKDTLYKTLAMYGCGLSGIYVKKYFMPANLFVCVKGGIGSFTFYDANSNILGQSSFSFAWDIMVGKEFLLGSKKRFGLGGYVDLFKIQCNDVFPHSQNVYSYLGPGLGVNFSFH
jgi:hypothetical protein